MIRITEILDITTELIKLVKLVKLLVVRSFESRKVHEILDRNY